MWLDSRRENFLQRIRSNPWERKNVKCSNPTTVRSNIAKSWLVLWSYVTSSFSNCIPPPSNRHWGALTKHHEEMRNLSCGSIEPAPTLAGRSAGTQIFKIKKPWCFTGLQGSLVTFRSHLCWCRWRNPIILTSDALMNGVLPSVTSNRWCLSQTENSHLSFGFKSLLETIFSSKVANT